MLEISDENLAGKIFTFDKSLCGKKMDEMTGKDLDFKDEMKDLQAMDGVNNDFMMSFKFFKVNKSKVKTMKDEPEKIMLAFIDIS